MNKMIMNRLTMLAVTLMASVACFAQGKFDKGLVTSIGTGKAKYAIFDYQELRYRVLKENWVDEPHGLEGYEVEIIGFASQISGADGNPDYISNSSIDNEVGYDNKITIGHVITKEVAGVDVHVIAVASNAFTSTTCYNDDAANKSKFAEAAAKVKTIKFDFNPGINDKFADLSVPTINATAFAGLTSLTTVEGFYPSTVVTDMVKKNAFPNNVYKTAELTVPEGAIFSYSSKTGWKSFLKMSDRSDIPVIRGDVDGDGYVDDFDMTSIITYFKKGKYKEKYDIDGDGFVDDYDAALVLEIFKVR